MKFITTIVQKMKRIVLNPQEKRVLGRWNMEYNTKKMNHKIDLSNEDHCGPCGQYILNTNTNMKNMNMNTYTSIPKEVVK
jgi:hypothetical protein